MGGSSTTPGGGGGGWTIRSPYGEPQQPLIMAGDRLVGVTGGTEIYAFNIFTGEEIRVDGGFPYTSAGGLDGPLTVAAGRVFYMEGGQLQARDLADGKPAAGWPNPAPSLDNIQSLAGAGDAILAVQGNWGATSIAAYHAADGSPAWPNGALSPSNFSTGAVALGTDAIFYVAQKQLFATNTRFGETRFPKDPTKGPTYPLDETRPPLITPSTVICVADRVYGFDIKKGSRTWDFSGSLGATQWWSALSDDRSWVVAVSGAGELFVLDAAGGNVLCQTTIPEGGQPAVVRNGIHVVSADNRHLSSLSVDLGRKQVTRQGHFDLGQNVSAVGPVAGNGTLFLPTTDGNITALPFGIAEAPYFDGTTSVSIHPDTGQFSLGSGDFTLEAWVRSSQGGEIIASYPASDDSSNHGFRLNLNGDGELRLAVLNSQGSNADAYSTGPTHASDGFWHHVAATRAAGKIALYVDGISLPVFSRQLRNNVVKSRQGVAVDANNFPMLDQLSAVPLPEPAAIGAQTQLTIGAYRDPANPAGAVFWRGLLREVRVWDRAADAATLQSRMHNILTPDLAHLRGNWHLNANLSLNETIGNDVEGHEYPADFVNGRSVTTDLALDDTFPFLLHQEALQWPYTARWSARGDGDIVSAPTLSDDGVIFFHSRNGVYGVDKSTGARQWSIPLDVVCSRAAAYGQAFFLMVDDLGVIKIDSRTGHYTVAPSFEMLQPPPKATFLPAPAHDGRYLAAAIPSGLVWVQDFNDRKRAVRSFQVGANPGDLVLEQGRLFSVCGADGEQKQLHIVDLGGAAEIIIPVDSKIFRAYRSWVFFIVGGQLTVIDLSKASNNQWSATAMPGSAITGLAADADAGLLVVSTNQGKVYGLSFATLGQSWVSTIPEGNAASARAAQGFLNPPSVDGRDVFVTSRSGVVAALDGHNGQLRGLFIEPNAVLDAPLEDNGTVYFGCDGAAPAQPLDGGLHNVVFGETYVLRLGLDPLDRDDLKPGYARIEKVEPKDALAFRDATQCSVEAWFNTNESGEILSLCPSSASRQGLRLRVEAPGTVRFTLYHQPEASADWRQVEATASIAGLCDGMWHHVAVSVKSETDARIYVDNHAETVTVTAGVATCPHIAPGSLIYIGADATQSDGAAGNFFRGMIAEVRVWDTYLTADDIGSRMHDKLRGDEPDLAAYWNFDALGVVDASRNGFDGAFAPDGGDATYWLADLHFEHPNYPDIATEAYIQQAGEANLPAGDPHSQTVYQLKLTARDGAGAGQAGMRLRLWYVQHADIHDPDSVTLFVNSRNVVLQGIPPHAVEDNPPIGTAPSGGSQPKYSEATTDSSGSVAFAVYTNELTHGPSFDLWAEYMPAHERYHINALLNNQANGKPSPPYLAAQSKLIQDYHWSTGGDIDENHSRATYRTVIRCCEADHTPRGNEQIRVFATGHLQVEVAGQQYAVNEQNSQTFCTNTNGELTIVVSADDLKPPSFSLWAGFMNPEARYVVDPAQDAHDGIANAKGDDMKDSNRMTNWRPASKGGPERAALLNDDYKPHSDEIAGTVRHVMSSTAGKKPADGGQAPLGLAGDSPARNFRDLRQPISPEFGDAVRALPTMRHIHRKATVTPEYLQRSLQDMAPGAVGFHLKVDPSSKAFSFRYLMSASDAAVAMGVPAAPPMLRDLALGDVFSDAWDDAKSLAESAWEKAQEIAVVVDDAITVALKSVDSVVHIVVNSIEEAVLTVVNFLKKLALEIWQIILFLLMLLDWEAIIKAHNIVRDCIYNSAKRLLHEYGNAQTLRDALYPLADVLGLSIPGGGSTASIASVQAGAPASPALASVRGVGANQIRSKAEENAGEMTVAAAVPFADVADDALQAGSDLLTGLIELIPQLPGMSPADAANAILNLLKTVAADLLKGLIDIVADMVAGLAAAAELLLDAVDSEIYIPFLSALYKWVTGNTLSLLDLICLALGAAAHVVSCVVTGHAFYTIADDLAGSLLPRPQVRAAAAAGDLPLGDAEPQVDAYPLSYGRPDNQAVEISYLVFRGAYIASTAVTDALFYAEAQDKSGNPNRLRAVFKVLRGISGIVSGTLMFVCSYPDYAHHLAKAFNDAGRKPNDVMNTSWEKYVNLNVKSVYAFSLAADLVTLVAGAIGLGCPEAAKVAPEPAPIPLKPLGGSAPAPVPAPMPGWTDALRAKITPANLDRAEFAVLSGRACLLCVVMCLQFARGASGAEYQDGRIDDPPNSGILKANKLLLSRDVLNSAAKVPAFIYTRTWFNLTAPPWQAYAAAAVFRGACTVSALTLHGIAEMDYLLKLDE